LAPSAQRQTFFQLHLAVFLVTWLAPVTAMDLLTEPRLMPLHLQPAVDHQKPVHLPLGWQGVCLAPLNPLADVSLRLSLPAPSWMNLQLAFHLHSAALLELRLAPSAQRQTFFQLHLAVFLVTWLAPWTLEGHPNAQGVVHLPFRTWVHCQSLFRLLPALLDAQQPPHQPQPQDLLGCQSPALSSRFDSPETPASQFALLGHKELALRQHRQHQPPLFSDHASLALDSRCQQMPALYHWMPRLSCSGGHPLLHADGVPQSRCFGSPILPPILRQVSLFPPIVDPALLRPLQELGLSQ